MTHKRWYETTAAIFVMPVIAFVFFLTADQIRRIFVSHVLGIRG